MEDKPHVFGDGGYYCPQRGGEETRGTRDDEGVARCLTCGAPVTPAKVGDDDAPEE